MFELKTYQSETLQALREFLEEARLMPVEEAFTRTQQHQNRQPFFAVELPQFEIREAGRVFEVFLQGGHVSYKLAEQGETPNLNLIELDIDDTVLVRWLDREVRQTEGKNIYQQLNQLFH